MSREATTFRRDVQVGDVVGEVAAAGLHWLGGAVGAVDVLAPQHVVDAEFVGAVRRKSRISSPSAMPSGLVGSPGTTMSSARPSSCSWSGSGRNPPISSICGNAADTCSCDCVALQPRVGGLAGGVGLRERRGDRGGQEQPAGEGSQDQRQAGGDGAPRHRGPAHRFSDRRSAPGEDRPRGDVADRRYG